MVRVNEVVWVCQDWDRKWIQDVRFTPELHLLKGWSHTGRCGVYELVPREETA
jgi:hypothetical protein